MFSVVFSFSSAMDTTFKKMRGNMKRQQQRNNCSVHNDISIERQVPVSMYLVLSENMTIGTWQEKIQCRVCVRTVQRGETKHVST
jgi:hypothetical protein